MGLVLMSAAARITAGSRSLRWALVAVVVIVVGPATLARTATSGSITLVAHGPGKIGRPRRISRSVDLDHHCFFGSLVFLDLSDFLFLSLGLCPGFGFQNGFMDEPIHLESEPDGILVVLHVSPEGLEVSVLGFVAFFKAGTSQKRLILRSVKTPLLGLALLPRTRELAPRRLMTCGGNRL